MKRLGCLLLALMLMLAFPADALAAKKSKSGSTYAGDIQFNHIPWGASITEASDILSAQDIAPLARVSVDYPELTAVSEIVLSAHSLCDPLYLINLHEGNLELPSLIERSAIREIALADISSVAGHDIGSAVLLFAYVPEDGQLVYDDAHTALYCGGYMCDVFNEDEYREVKDDLLEKLTGIYGDPFYSGNDLSFLFEDVRVTDAGRKMLSEKDMKTYSDMVKEFKKKKGYLTSTVWKSGETNACIVLTTFEMGIDFMVSLAYLNTDGFDWLAEADALAEPYSVPEADDHKNDTSGL